MSRSMIEHDQRLKLTTFSGPGGFTQIVMSQNDSFAIAQVLGLQFRAKNSGDDAR